MKRCVTDELYNSQSAANASNSNGLDPDLLARLRNAGSRVRKSVTEGYRRSGAASAGSSSSQTRLPFTQSLSFSSSRDILRDVLESGVPTVVASDRKRKHNILDDEDVLDDNDEMCMDEPASRPIKPLRNISRRFNKTQSLPAGMPSFQQALPGCITDGTPAPLEMLAEEDWSAHSFAASTPRTLNLS